MRRLTPRDCAWHQVIDSPRSQVQVVELLPLARGRTRHAAADPRCGGAQHRRRGRACWPWPTAAALRRCDGRCTPSRQRPVQHHARRRLHRRHALGPRRSAGLRAQRHRPLAEALSALIASWPAQVERSVALQAARDFDGGAGGAQVERLVLGLPAADLQPPPRRPEPAVEPASRSASATRPASRVYDYQGNWRDIFQNWEALGASYPGLPRAVRSASSSTPRPPTATTPTASPDPASTGRSQDPTDPWSHIGYWGDHQIVYLLAPARELRPATSPAPSPRRCGRADLRATRTCPTGSPASTPCWPTRERRSSFDEALHRALLAARQDLGADGKLVRDDDGEVRLVTPGREAARAAAGQAHATWCPAAASG